MMAKDCEFYRNQIPKFILGDLQAADRSSLEKHLADCAACAQEKDLYTGTFRQMQMLEDVPVPRHFFVYPEEGAANPWRLFRMMRPAWQGAVAVALLTFGFLGAFAASRIQVRSGDGAWTIAFGRIPAKPAPPASTPTVNTAALEEKILQIIEEKNRKEKTEWVRTLRSEIARTQRGLSRQQQISLEATLARLETRMGARIDQTARSIQDQNDRSMANLYQAVLLQRERDMAAVDSKLTRLAVNGEIKSTQTDAILETLLQVAEFRMK